ncbi:MAG TPA: OmpH family outer membrane protein [Rhodothermales bacterium]|nr:OmpH family outer membrane protein [Rhodothermales bacterium]
MKKLFLILPLVACVGILLSSAAMAQQKLAYVDSEYIFSKLPEFATMQQQLDRMAQEWQTELETQQREVDEMFQEYQARELLYTQEERQRKRDEIVRAEEELERQRMQYFGPEGEMFRQQEQLLKPLQERVLAVIEEVATTEGYDYVFDKSGDVLFLYARDEYDLSDQVLEELGIEIESTGRSPGR